MIILKATELFRKVNFMACESCTNNTFIGRDLSKNIYAYMLNSWTQRPESNGDRMEGGKGG